MGDAYRRYSHVAERSPINLFCHKSFPCFKVIKDTCAHPIVHEFAESVARRDKFHLWSYYRAKWLNLLTFLLISNTMVNGCYVGFNKLSIMRIIHKLSTRRQQLSLKLLGAVTRSEFPSHMQPEASSFTMQHSVRPYNLHSSSTNYLEREVPASRYGAFGMNAVSAIEHRAEPGLGVTTGSSLRGYPPPLQDTNPVSQRRDVSVRISPSIPEIMYERPNTLQKADVFSAPEKESNILFVDGLPRDCTRREVGHLFRPFIGFKDIRVVHKEPRRSGEKAMVLCFVEFIDAKCALTALEALQGYKFDDKKPDSSSLKIKFAHFPFQPPSDRDKLPSDRDNQHVGILR